MTRQDPNLRYFKICYAITITLLITSTYPYTTVGQEQRVSFADAVTIRNDQIQVTVSPSAGRMVSFGKINGPNLLWINSQSDCKTIYHTADGIPYFDYGGDKLWSAPQPLWRFATGHDTWPPDGIIDGKQWELVEHTANRIVIQSQFSPAYGITASRTFELADHAAQLTIHNRFDRSRHSHMPLMIWSVTQIQQPKQLFMHVADNTESPFHPYILLSGHMDEHLKNTIKYTVKRPNHIQLDLATPQQTKFKLGTMGQWIAAVYKDTVLIQRTNIAPQGAYPEASNIQAYWNSQAAFCEIELLSPLQHPQCGQSMQNTITWNLTPTNLWQNDATIIPPNPAAH